MHSRINSLFRFVTPHLRHPAFRKQQPGFVLRIFLGLT